MIKKHELVWSTDEGEFTLRGLRFLEVQVSGHRSDLVPGENCFLFYKMRPLVEQYLDWFATLGELQSDHIVELGLYQAGSVPFWFEFFAPRKYVGIDLGARPKSRYFDEYASTGERRGRIETHWGIAQDDATELPTLIDDAFGGQPIDIVLDDASHLYSETKGAFELLFPLVRTGGIYIIEDWAWSHWRGTEQDFSGHRPLTDLVVELIELCGSTGQHVIRDVHVCGGFVAVRRGEAPAKDLEGSFIDRLAYRHPRKATPGVDVPGAVTRK